MRTADRSHRFSGLSSAWGRCGRGGLAAAGTTLLVAGMMPVIATPALAAGMISLTGPYTQDFNSLSNVSGSTTNRFSIVGWDLTESDDAAVDNEQYGVDTGESSAGDTYSYGSADADDRALGGLSDDTLIPTIGASFTNTTGAPITSLDIAYTGEQWRLGTADRSDRLDFQISTSATSLTTGTWTDVDALDFATPSSGSPTGPRDGNDAANRTSVSSSIRGFSIPDGATFWIRWVGVDVDGPDDGLAVDDLAVIPHAEPVPVVTETDPADGDTGVAPGASVSITFDEPVTAAGEWFTIDCARSGAHGAMASGGPTHYVLDPATDFEAGEKCTVTVIAAGVTDEDTDDPPDTPSADHVFSFTTQPAALAEPPIANDDAASTNEDSPVGIRGTVNDTDADGDLVPGTVRVVLPPADGNVAVAAGGTIRYRPDRDFHGRDRFEYEVCDAGGRCDRASVTVSVAAVADRPVAGDDIASTDEDSPIDIPVTANDTDADGDLVPVAVQIIRPPAAGNATVAPDGTIKYRPDRDFHGRDRFAYRVCDAGGRCDRASVTVSVAAVADRPVAGDDIASTDEDSPIDLPVTANDTDADGDLDAESVVVVGKPAHGRAVIVRGSVEYRPDANFHGQDRFDYRVCDARSTCVTASVTVAIRPVNDAPVATSDVVIVVRAGTVMIDVLANDADVDGSTDLDPTSVTIVAGPSLGTATANVASGAIEYTASPGTDGTDQLTYRVCDRDGRCATAELEIRIDLSPTPPPGTLPRTGPNFGSHAGAAALGAVGVGALLFTASRRTSFLRRRPSD